MSEMTPERAGKALDRSVDAAQLIGILTAIVGALTGGQLVVDDVTAGWAVIVGGLAVGVVCFLLGCWARVWLLAQTRGAVRP